MIMIRNLLILIFSYVVSRVAFSFITVDISSSLLKTIVETAIFIAIFLVLYIFIKPKKKNTND